MLRSPSLIAATWLCMAAAAHAEDSAARLIRIHVVANGWHAGLLVPAAPLNELVPALRQRFPAALQYEIGWGDIGFYQAADITTGLALEALFASRGSVLHVVGLPNAVGHFLKGSDVAELCISADAHQRMASQIAQAFARGDDGGPVPLRAGIYGDSQFYKARGTYSLLNTCNRWSATVLEAAGVAITPILSLTAGSVMSAARQPGHACPAPAQADITPPP